MKKEPVHASESSELCKAPGEPFLTRHSGLAYVVGCSSALALLACKVQLFLEWNIIIYQLKICKKLPKNTDKLRNCFSN